MLAREDPQRYCRWQRNRNMSDFYCGSSFQSCPEPGRRWRWLVRRLVLRHHCGVLPLVLINLDEQRLFLYRQARPVACYPISTSRFGAGNIEHSLRTPLGVHRVSELIGADAPPLTVFKARQASGEIATINSPSQQGLDLVCSRVVRLVGLEPGTNLGGDCDSEQRNIYIHGTSDEQHIGMPASQGCVRMKNQDVIELFDQLVVGSLVHLFAAKTRF